MKRGKFILTLIALFIEYFSQNQNQHFYETEKRI